MLVLPPTILALPPPVKWTFTTSHSPYAGATAPTQTNMSDGLATTYYAAATDAASWVEADFGERVRLSTVFLADAGGQGGWGSTHLNGAAIEGSNDDVTWTALATAAGHTGNAAEVSYAVAGAGGYRYVRVRRGANWVALSQLRFA